MTKTTHIRGPQISAVIIFRRLAPTYARELSHQLHRAGVRNTNDLIWALTTGLSSFAKEHGVCLATDFPKAWPEALQALRTARSDDEWERLLPQTAAAPEAANRELALGASQMIQILEASRDVAQMSPRVVTALGVWIITAVVIAHSGPIDADLSLEQLAECL
jgi:hypothetical protein